MRQFHDKIKQCVTIAFSDSHTSDVADRSEAILTSVKTKSVDSNLDFMEEMTPESKRDYEDF